MKRQEIANIILNKLVEQKNDLKKQFNKSKNTIGHFYIDDLLPEELAFQVNSLFPTEEEMVELNSLREHKHIGFQMNMYNTLLEEVLYAFQDNRIVSVIAEICNKENQMLPDESLYAGGLSLMAQNNYLKPHLDNSHDKDRNLWRVVNLLYYVSPDWELKNGGNLEIWPNGLKKEPVTIVSKFNRLAIMETHNQSWHSVSKVLSKAPRKCISNYYFSKIPMRISDTFHVTTFRANNANEKLLDTVLQTDNFIRSLIRKVFKHGVKKTKHVYKKDLK